MLVLKRPIQILSKLSSKTGREMVIIMIKMQVIVRIYYYQCCKVLMHWLKEEKLRVKRSDLGRYNRKSTTSHTETSLNSQIVKEKARVILKEAPLNSLTQLLTKSCLLSSRIKLHHRPLYEYQKQIKLKSSTTIHKTIPKNKARKKSNNSFTKLCLLDLYNLLCFANKI